MLTLLWKGREGWLVKPIAARLFLVSTILLLAGTPLLFGRVEGKSLVAQILWGSLGVIGGPAVLFLWSGMWCYWSRLDGSAIRAKRFWFVVLLVGFWYGSALYFYCVYWPRIRRAGE
jgi:hypothetical protein